MQVAEGVFQFNVPMAQYLNTDRRVRYTLVYAIDLAPGWLLIDTGSDSDDGFGALTSQLDEAGIAAKDIRLIAMTHGHGDHIGLANRMRTLCDAPVALHRLDAADPYVFTYRPGVAMPAVDVLLEGDEELVPRSGLWSVWTPGHTPGHICIHDRGRGLLFSGDHVLPTITPNVSLFPGDAGNPLLRFIDSQAALKGLGVTRVHPAHEYSFDDLGARVDEIIEHHEKRAREILAVIESEELSAWDVTAKMDWGRRRWKDMETATRQAALMEINAHLEYLVAKGQLKRTSLYPEALVESLSWLKEGDATGCALLMGIGRLGTATLTSPSLSLSGLKVTAGFDVDLRQIGLNVGGIEVQPASGLAEFVRGSGVKAAILAVPARFADAALETLLAAGIERVLSYSLVKPSSGAVVNLREIDGLNMLQVSTRFSSP
jgi:glyoxylase-like metal-dependent hydrolase (beta-lactamase superfamily II)/NADH/NAD ratio-sensing transcriptional regulator Rex